MADPRPRRPRSDGQKARLRILDSAEALFAERGFHGTSIRDITERAGVRLAAVNYHFVSKDSLLRDVLQRRAAVLEDERMGRLSRLLRRGSALSRTTAVVRAFVLPLVPHAEADAGFRNYLALIAQIGSSRLQALTLVESTYNPLAQRFIEALASIFPHAGSAALHHGYTFMLASTMYSFSDNLRLNSMTQGKLRSDDFAAISESLVRFVASGLRGLCGARRKGARKRPARRRPVSAGEAMARRPGEHTNEHFASEASTERAAKAKQRHLLRRRLS